MPISSTLRVALVIQRLPLAMALLAFAAAHAGAIECGEPWSGFSHAQLISGDLSDELLPPAELQAEVERDLALIYADTPAVAAIHVLSDPMLGVVVLSMSPGDAASGASGDHQGLQRAYAELGATPTCRADASWGSFGTLVLEFAQPYDPSQLAALFSDVVGVHEAYANRLGYLPCAVPAPYVRRTVEHTYEFYDYSGCVEPSHWERWVFEVTGDVVTLVSHSGTLVPIETTSWGRLKTHFR